LEYFLCRINNNIISYGNPVKLVAVTTGCKGMKNEVIFLEHVSVRTTINYTIRGALEIHLTSPAGKTTSPVVTVSIISKFSRIYGTIADATKI